MKGLVGTVVVFGVKMEVLESCGFGFFCLRFCLTLVHYSALIIIIITSEINERRLLIIIFICHFLSVQGLMPSNTRIYLHFSPQNT